ncbi:MAG: hypothetical protein ACPL7G_11085, partial [Chloroflexia bacterium]
MKRLIVFLMLLLGILAAAGRAWAGPLGVPIGQFPTKTPLPTEVPPTETPWPTKTPLPTEVPPTETP